MAEIRDLVLTLLNRLSHHALPKNRKRETLDACIRGENIHIGATRYNTPNKYFSLLLRS